MSRWSARERIAAQPPVERVDPFELGAGCLNG
jgi:hypothetical protein